MEVVDILKSFSRRIILCLAMAAFIITASKLADLYGRRLVMLIGVAIFGVFSFACMMANSLSFLIAFRFFQGIGKQF